MPPQNQRGGFSSCTSILGQNLKILPYTTQQMNHPVNKQQEHHVVGLEGSSSRQVKGPSPPSLRGNSTFERQNCLMFGAW